MQLLHHFGELLSIKQAFDMNRTLGTLFRSQCIRMSDRSLCLPTGAGSEAFCSGGDQSVRGPGGYVGADTIPRLNVLDLQASPTRCVAAVLLPQLHL